MGDEEEGKEGLGLSKTEALGISSLVPLSLTHWTMLPFLYLVTTSKS